MDFLTRWKREKYKIENECSLSVSCALYFSQQRQLQKSRSNLPSVFVILCNHDIATVAIG